MVTLKALDEYGVTTILATPESPYTYKAGIYGFGACSNNINELIFINNSGLFTIKSYNETETIYSINHPSSDTDWEIIRKEMTVNYNNPDGIYVSGNQDAVHMALYPDAIPVLDYTAIATFRFVACNNIVGAIMFNYDGTDVYYAGELNYNDAHPYVRIMKWESGVYTVIESLDIPFIYGNDYELKLKISNSQSTAKLYLDGVEKISVNI
jgi:hypothetical protein